MTSQSLVPRRHRRLAVLARVCLGATLLAAAEVQAERVDVGAELERLMGIHGFNMRPADLASAREVEGRAEGEALIPRLRTLLENFDHVIVQAPGGGVERVLILGEKAPYVPPAPQPPQTAQGEPAAEDDGEPAADDIVLDSQRKGSSHAVTLTLEGSGGRRMQRMLLLDTGADYVVLPSSLIAPLAIPADGLRSQPVQTANGTVEAQIGKLTAVWLGGQRITDVDAAFIEDERLGGNALLGMSVLGRFRVTIDDDANQIVLGSK
jgi:clan AA aspartic protease (TIGR02281 family)